MGGKNVKNTIFEGLLSLIAPHHCYGCGELGAILCECCEYDIIYDEFSGCFLCGFPASYGLCDIHQSSLLDGVFIATFRVGPAKQMIDSLKFHNLKKAAKETAQLIAQRLPILPMNTVLVPIPTLPSHIRTRGYDQVKLITAHLSQLLRLPVLDILEHVGNKTQHQLSKADRQKSSFSAFKIKQNAYPIKDAHTPNDTTFLMVDDIITTGSTVTAAAELLKKFKMPILATAAVYQPLEKP